MSVLALVKTATHRNVFLNDLNSEMRCQVFSNFEEAFEKSTSSQFDFIFADLDIIRDMGEGELKRGLLPIQKSFPSSSLIVMSKSDDARECIAAVKEGASNYLNYPLQKEEIVHLIESEKEKRIIDSQLNVLQKRILPDQLDSILSSKNQEMQSLLTQLKAVAQTKSTVLITGESGTGKSLLAKLIHHLGTRRDESFLSVHCGVISESLIESELFGHEKGSFTGAIKRKLGKFELANRGTIFLDEIGTISPQAQIKLLQVLQEMFFQRVGGEEDIHVDVRVIAATNVNFDKLIEQGRFREDLFYRLNVFQLEMPPLRSRVEDIESLAYYFLEKNNRIHNKAIDQIDLDVLQAFKLYHWPGNIRELENIIERAYILATGRRLTKDNFPRTLFGQEIVTMVSMQEQGEMEVNSLAEVRRRAVDDVERKYLIELLSKTQGKINQTAELAGITTRQLHKLMVKYSLKRTDFNLKP